MNRLITIICTIFLFSTISLFAQKDINSYKYIIIPEQFEFQKGVDQYQINSLTLFLFEKEGFNTISTGEVFPDELAKNSCSALKSVLRKNSNMFTTKITIELVDCFNNVVFTSVEGASKIKEYQKAYHEAIREAFESVKELDYKYDGSSQSMVKALEEQEPTNEIKTVDEASEQKINEVVEETEVVVIVEEMPVKDEVITASSNVENEVKTIEKAPEVAVVTAAVVVPTEEIIVPNEVVIEYSIEGNYFIDIWGECAISKKGNDYKVVGGDENFEFATIYKTSQSNIFMIKKVGFNQTKLVELDQDGNLKIDTDSGVKIYKRVD